MRTVVITGFNRKFAELAEITLPRMSEWARLRGYEYNVRYYTEDVNPYYAKIGQVIYWLNQVERVIWLDVDQLITNFAASFNYTEMEQGAHFSRDWGVDATEDQHFSACGFVACRDSLPLFEWVESVRGEYQDKPFPEQTPLRLAYKRDWIFETFMHIHPRRVFNAVPIEVHESVAEPWQPGDFAMHCTMLDIDARVALARKYAV